MKDEGNIAMQNMIYSKYKNKEDIKIKKETLEWIGILVLFIFSFVNTITLLISLILLVLLLFQKEIGAIKIINIITLRTIINPGIAVEISVLQNIKWLILFGCSVYLLSAYFKLPKNILIKTNRILFLISLFTVFNVFVALVFSSLPTIAIFKLISYIVIFTGTLIGIGFTIDKYDWIKWLLNIFYLIIIVSVLFIATPLGYLRNGTSFQGITNHPNMFGILTVLFLSLLFSSLNIVKRKNGFFIQKIYTRIFILLMVFSSLYMVILSKSRTAFISCLILILLYIVFNKAKNNRKLIFNFYFTLVIILLLITTSISEFIIEFLYKSQEQGDLLYSRQAQIESLTTNFIRNPLFGNGFAVPVLPYKSFEFSSAFIVEPGNLILAILSYSGIIGAVLFIGYIMQILYLNRVNFVKIGFLPLATLLISMGEMVFFSSNNIGIWCYMFLAIYLYKN